MPMRSRSNSRKPNRRRRVAPCHFCHNPKDVIGYQNVNLISRFLTSRGKIIGRQYSGTCAAHQRILGQAVKRARTLSLLPYTEVHSLD